MQITIYDETGMAIGRHSLNGTRWSVHDGAFHNIGRIDIPLHREGRPMSFSIDGDPDDQARTGVSSGACLGIAP